MEKTGTRKQAPTPPDTWNDAKAMRDSFQMWFGWYGLKKKREAQEAFRRGWRAGAMTATAAMWRWIQRAVFGHEAKEDGLRPQLERDLSVLDERQIKALNMILETADWLIGAAGVMEKGMDPDKVIAHVCKEGPRRIRNIRKYQEDDHG